MQGLQHAWRAKDVVWLTINSTNQQHPEFKTAAQMSQWMQSKGALQSAVLIDGTSATGRQYAAKTTPQMFVIDPTGKVVYDGAIDDHRSWRAPRHMGARSSIDSWDSPGRMGSGKPLAWTTFADGYRQAAGAAPSASFLGRRWSSATYRQGATGSAPASCLHNAPCAVVTSANSGGPCASIDQCAATSRGPLFRHVQAAAMSRGSVLSKC